MGKSKDPVRGADRAIDDVFITPRVIDRRAMEEYSATLQDLIREAAGRGESLATAATDVKALGESLREATKELKARLEVAVKVMPTLEQRLGKADQILQLATDRTKLAEHLDRAIEALIADRVAQAEKRAAGIIDAAEQRAAKLQSGAESRVHEVVEAAAARLEALAHSKLAQAQDRLTEAHRSAVDQAESATSTLSPRLSALESAVHTLDRAIASRSSALEQKTNESLAVLRDDLVGRRRELDELAAATAGQRAAWNEALNAAEARALALTRTFDEAAAAATHQASAGIADQLHGELHARLRAESQAKLTEFQGITAALARSVSEKSEAASRELESRLGEGLRHMEAIAVQTSAHATEPTRTPEIDPAGPIAALQALIERAERLTAGADDASLSAMVSRGEELRSSAIKAAGQFEDIRQQADLAKVMLGDWINTAAARIDLENERHAALQNSVEASGARIESARQAQENLARTLSQTIELAQQAARMLSSASAPLAATPAAGSVPPPPPAPLQGTLPPAARDSIERVREEFLR